jgi:ABC-2 type transport system ATP-binding protein
MNPILELSHVSKAFASFQLSDVSFSLPPGYIMGLVGPNGAGKTTTIRLILNALSKDSGDIHVFSMDHAKHEQEIKQQIGVVYDSLLYPDTWTLRDTQNAIALFYKNWNRQRFAALVSRFHLPEKQKLSTFSRGMQMKLMLACALSHDARLLILDEPTSGLDPVARDELMELLQEYIQDAERSVLFSTHITSDLEQVADYITFIKDGRLFFTGSKDELLSEYVLIKGGLGDLSPELSADMIGFRQSSVGFEGLLPAQHRGKYPACAFERPSIDNIMVYAVKGGQGLA